MNKTMNKNKIMVLRGLPASGKTTFAKTLVKQGWIRTNKDDIRADLFPNYTRKDEKKVVKERNRLILDAFRRGYNVVVDDTNLNPVHLKDIATLAREQNVDFEVNDSFLDVPLLECIERDKKRENPVGQQVIRDMFHQYIRKPNTALEYNPDLPMVVICDIDGTLAHMEDRRKPFDWSKVGLDTVDEGVAHILDGVKFINYAKIFLFSGRDEISRKETEKWLERNGIEYDLLAMRKADTNNDDREVKKEMLEKYVIGRYNVLFVIDDRPKICRMWHDVYGLTTLRVGDPYREF